MTLSGFKGEARGVCVCVCVCVFVCGCVCGCYHDNSKLRASILTKLGLYFVGKGSDHLQLIKFWPSRAPGKGSAAGRIFLAPTGRSVCVSSERFFSL